MNDSDWERIREAAAEVIKDKSGRRFPIPIKPAGGSLELSIQTLEEVRQIAKDSGTDLVTAYRMHQRVMSRTEVDSPNQ